MERVECAEKESTEKEYSRLWLLWDGKRELSIVKKVAQCEWHMWMCVCSGLIHDNCVSSFGNVRKNGERCLLFCSSERGEQKKKNSIENQWKQQQRTEKKFNVFLSQNKSVSLPFDFPFVMLFYSLLFWKWVYGFLVCSFFQNKSYSSKLSHSLDYLLCIM